MDSLISIRLSTFALLSLLFAVLPALAEDSPGFVRDVMPVLTKAGCNGGKCHGSFQGRGGFRLSLLGFEPSADHEALVREGRGRRLSLTAPEQSLILRKAAGLVPHGGGIRMARDSAEFRTLASWIRGGASRPEESLKVERLIVEPKEVVLKRDAEQSLQVKAVWSDGLTTDATSLALYESREEQTADVDAGGVVTAHEYGRTAVTITFMGQVSAVTVTVPYVDTSPGHPGFIARNEIDRLIAEEWKKVNLKPAPPADDLEFLRRPYLDIIGTLPTPDEVREFLKSKDADKRSSLIDELLERPEYVDAWSTKWGDLLRVHRRYLGEKGLWSYWGWVRNAVRENRPVDRMARELITSKGSLFGNGATGFYYVDAKPEDLAETTAQVFLGIRLQCARCHHHPYEVWSQDDYYGLASFFTRLQIKDNGDGARYGGTKLLRPVSQVAKERRLKIQIDPRAFGHEVDPAESSDVRVELADWITSPENPWFAKSFVNRIWAHFMGRGLVEPVDDLRATNPATHPQLLDWLAKDFVEHDYDTKHLIRTICNSHAYQLGSRVRHDVDPSGTFYVSRTYRRMSAAVMLDAVNFACGTTEEFAGLPRGTRAQALPDPQIPSYFLTVFGRSDRASSCECAQSNDLNLAQALHIVCGDNIGSKVSAKDGRIARLLKSSTPHEDIVEELYLVTFSRLPTEQERELIRKLAPKAESKKILYEDILWALMNSTEFVFNH